MDISGRLFALTEFIILLLINTIILLLSRFSGRKRKWFKLEDALNMLRLHKPTQHTYLESFALNQQKAST